MKLNYIYCVYSTCPHCETNCRQVTIHGCFSSHQEAQEFIDIHLHPRINPVIEKTEIWRSVTEATRVVNGEVDISE